MERWTEAGGETAFDLIDAEGRVIDRVLLPPERRLVAFGDGTLYATFHDALDLE